MLTTEAPIQTGADLARQQMTSVLEALRVEIMERLPRDFAGVEAAYKTLMAADLSEQSIIAHYDELTKLFQGSMGMPLFTLWPDAFPKTPMHPDLPCPLPGLVSNLGTTLTEGVCWQMKRIVDAHNTIDQAEIDRQNRAAAFIAQEQAEEARKERMRRGELD